MTLNSASGPVILCLLLCGTGCAPQQVAPAADCAPEIVVEERLIELDPELLIPQPCPAVPRRGDNETFLDWAENCAISARMVNDQLRAIRELQRDTP